MKYPWDIPGLVSGFRFDDTNPDCYDSDNEEFIEQSGFSHLRIGNAGLRAGTPAFDTLGLKSRRGLKLDNSNHWDIPNGVAWEGTLLFAFKPVCPSAPTVQHRIIVGNKATTVTSNTNVYVQKASGAITLRVASVSAVISAASASLTNAQTYIGAISVKQEDRKMRVTLDGSTVVASSAYSDNNSGMQLAFSGGAAPTPTDLSAMYLRLGNNDGTIGSTTANATDYIIMGELWQFTGDIITAYASTLQDVMADMLAEYNT